MALLKCYSKCFRHKFVNLFHVCVGHWNPALLCLTCSHDVSCSLQAKSMCWIYFMSVFTLARQLGETGLKFRKVVPGHVLQLSLSVSDLFKLFPDTLTHHWQDSK